MQPGFHGSCGGWDLCEKSLIYRDDLTGKAAPRERTPDMPVLPGGGGNNWILKSRGSHTNPIPSCLPDGSGSL